MQRGKPRNVPMPNRRTLLTSGLVGAGALGLGLSRDTEDIEESTKDIKEAHDIVLFRKFEELR